MIGFMYESKRPSLEEMVGPEQYRNRACRGVNPEIFFPVEKDELPKGIYRFPTEEIAIKICRECTIVDACLNNACDECQTYGIRGGVNLEKFNS